jgi:hypothetical protein
MLRANSKHAQKFVSYQQASTSQVLHLARVNPYARKVGDTMNTPHGNFRWNGTRWEAISYTAPANAATPPPTIVTTNTTNVTSTGGLPGGGYIQPVPPNAQGYVAPPPPGTGTKRPVGMIKQPGPSGPVAPTRTERDSSDVTTVRSQLWKQQLILEELAEDVQGADGQNLDDALYFLREALEALNKISE